MSTFLKHDATYIYIYTLIHLGAYIYNIFIYIILIYIYNIFIQDGSVKYSVH